MEYTAAEFTSSNEAGFKIWIRSLLSEVANNEKLVWQIDSDNLPADSYINLMQVFYDEVKLKKGLVLQGEQYSLSTEQKAFWRDVYDLKGADYIDYTLVSLEKAIEYQDYKSFLYEQNIDKPTWLIFEFTNTDYANARNLWEQLVGILAEEVDVIIFTDVNLLDTNSSRLMSYFVLEFVHALIVGDYDVVDKGDYWIFSVNAKSYMIKKNIDFNWSGVSGVKVGLDYIGNEISDLADADVVW